jgi:hypothetical protein
VKLIIAGSRTLEPTTDFISSLLLHPEKVTRVVSGGAKGVDRAGEAWAESQGLPYVRFVPGWGLHHKTYAAFVRNHDMAFYADALLAIWDGHSKGTAHMIQAMRDLNKPVKVVHCATKNEHGVWVTGGIDLETTRPRR